MTWKEIWRAKGEYTSTEAYLNGCYDDKGNLIKGELFIEKHGISRTTTISIGLTKEQLKILCRILQVDLQETTT